MKTYEIIQESKGKEYAVSAIIPIYNVADYLAECLECMVNQTLKNMEIICINDGSSDQSLEIIKKFAEADDRFTVINQENQGVSASRNHGIMEAKGEYLYFMDGDDKLALHSMEDLYNVSKKDDLDIMYFNAVCFGNEIEVKKNQWYFQRKNEYPSITTGSQMFLLHENNKELKVSPCLQFVRKDHILSNHILFHEGVLHEDNAFSILSMLSAKKVGYVNQAYFYRRYRENSIMTMPKNFNHLYGCYMAAKDIADRKDIISKLSEEEQLAVHVVINRLLTDARNRYATMNDTERMKYQNLSLEERLDFEMLVVYPGKIKQDLIKAKTKFYHKLKIYHSLKNKFSREQMMALKKIFKK